jgi:hypothetical protein
MTIENRDNLGAIDGQQMYGMRVQGLAKASIGNGVLAGDVVSTALRATQKEAGADMSVDVQLGNCIINGTIYEEASDVNVAIAAAHATDERIDLIVYDVTAGNPAAVTGTPHATDPQVPDVEDDDDIPLAQVYVVPQDDGGYTGTIVDGDITDMRSFVKTGTKYLFMGVADFCETTALPFTDSDKAHFGMGDAQGLELGAGAANSTLYNTQIMIPEDMLTEEAVEIYFICGTDIDASSAVARMFLTVTPLVSGATPAADDYTASVTLTNCTAASKIGHHVISSDISSSLTRGVPVCVYWYRDGDHVDDTLTESGATHFVILGFYLKYTGIL